MIRFFLAISLCIALPYKAISFDDIDINWGKDFQIPYPSNSNPYMFSGEDYFQSLIAGKKHSLLWPVQVTGILLPVKPVSEFVENRTKNPLRSFLSGLFANFSKVDSMQDIYSWMGLHQYPAKKYPVDSPYFIPKASKNTAGLPMGVGIIRRQGAKGITFSCASCHSANLFGKKIIGLSNRFPRANSIFEKGKKAAKLSPHWSFSLVTGASRAERDMFEDLKNNIKAVGVKEPVVLGLDTSLAQVSMSLAHRRTDAYATKNRYYEEFPRYEPLKYFVADSKPATWWGLKYKNKWLSDGSVVSGNPILTNLLWNEIGRGTDLRILEEWLDENFQVIQDLTTATFSSEPPQITDFYNFSEEDLHSAKKGQALFENHCSKCHGYYLKAWSFSGSEFLTMQQQIKTLHLDYPQPTKVKDVGTDPGRWMGMKSLEQLNDLSISKRFGIKIEPQKGYVPPPLVGIWARWPYFHNNSIPNLCALLTPAEDRPKSFWMGEANSTLTDYDYECGGYPTGAKTPALWMNQGRDYLYQTSKEGLSNRGHSKGLKNKDGSLKFSKEERLWLIKYLQTL